MNTSCPRSGALETVLLLYGPLHLTTVTLRSGTRAYRYWEAPQLDFTTPEDVPSAMSRVPAEEKRYLFAGRMFGFTVFLHENWYHEPSIRGDFYVLT